MKQLLQSYRTGELWLAEVAAPSLSGRGGGAIVRTSHSLVSAGTERMIVELAKKSLIGKARARPDLVRKVIGKIRTEGLAAAMGKVFAKLDTPIPLGYSCAGVVVAAGGGGEKVEGVDATDERGTRRDGTEAKDSPSILYGPPVSPDSSFIPHPSSLSFRPGDRVACGGAGYATHAEVNFVPTNLMARIPANVSLEDAAFTTVGAIAMQGVRQADMRIGERVCVIGLGLVGLLTVQILNAAGCRVLGSDLDAGKCELASQLGAEAVVAGAGDVVAAAEAFSQGEGMDAVILTAATTSNQPIESAAEMLRVRGRVVIVGMVGMDVPREPFYKKELELRLSLSYGPGRYDRSYEEGGRDYPIGYVRWTEQRNMQSFLHLVSTGRVTPSKLVTHRFDIDDALAAYELLESNRQRCLGIVINYPQREPNPLQQRDIELRPVKAQAMGARGEGQGAREIGVGLIGAGNFAKGVLIPALKKVEGIDLVGVCTATGASGSQVAKKHDFAYSTTDSRKLLDDPRVNVAMIATRHDTHAALACAALAAGKHVFVEKPLCVKPQEFDDYEQAIEAAPGRCLMVGFNRRFSPHTQAIRKAFKDRGGPVMITYRVNAGRLPMDSWLNDVETGGGRIVGEVCHFVDWCEAVMGSVPVSVLAECIGTSDARIQGADNVVVTIRYQDGSVATIQYLSLGPADLGKERIEVFAEGRAAVVDDFISTTFIGGSHPHLKTRQDKGFNGEISAFFRCVREGGDWPIPLASMLRTTRVTFAILQSLGTGKPADLVAVGPA